VNIWSAYELTLLTSQRTDGACEEEGKKVSDGCSEGGALGSVDGVTVGMRVGRSDRVGADVGKLDGRDDGPVEG